MALNHIDALLNKFRLQKKKMRISVEKACKTFDPKNIGSVKKKEFIKQFFGLLLNFYEDELVRLFENIC